MNTPLNWKRFYRPKNKINQLFTASPSIKWKKNKKKAL